MNRLWEIREKAGKTSSKMSSQEETDEAEEAYNCGYEDGYEKAMREMRYRRYWYETVWLSIRHEVVYRLLWMAFQQKDVSMGSIQDV